MRRQRAETNARSPDHCEGSSQSMTPWLRVHGYTRTVVRVECETLLGYLQRRLDECRGVDRHHGARQILCEQRRGHACQRRGHRGEHHRQRLHNPNDSSPLKPERQVDLVGSRGRCRWLCWKCPCLPNHVKLFQLNSVPRWRAQGTSRGWMPCLRDSTPPARAPHAAPWATPAPCRSSTYRTRLSTSGRKTCSGESASTGAPYSECTATSGE